jgi:hypothetical protein
MEFYDVIEIPKDQMFFLSFHIKDDEEVNTNFVFFLQCSFVEEELKFFKRKKKPLLMEKKANWEGDDEKKTVTNFFFLHFIDCYAFLHTKKMKTYSRREHKKKN